MCVCVCAHACIVEETLRLVARKTNLDSTGAVKCCLPSPIRGISGEWGKEVSESPAWFILF